MNPPGYELWDPVSGNLVGSFPDRRAALAVVKEALERDGRVKVVSTALVEVRTNGESVVIAEDDDLIRLAPEAPVSVVTVQIWGDGNHEDSSAADQRGVRTRFPSMATRVGCGVSPQV